MTLVSNAFLLFVLFAVVVYYLVPSRLRWIVLLIFSYGYYVAGDVRAVIFLAFSTVVTWGFALLISRMQREGRGEGLLHGVVALGLICNFGMLGYVKYANFLIGNLNGLFHSSIPGLRVLFPLGISFYTFQSSGYLLDVYWKKIPAEENLLRYALFVSFFPQLMQGPISRYDKLAELLFTGHPFETERILRGLRRMLRGYFKKLVIADWAAVFVDAISGSPDQFRGAVALGMLLYYIQLYMDFSGAMDVVLGVGELFGITLPENFRRPYLANSLANFWKRWHITLGEWMMTYVFYPVSLTGVAHKISVWGKKRFGRKTGRALQVAYAELIVFLLVGIWHGADWLSVLYGLYHGVIIAAAELLSPCFAAWKKALHITGQERGFQIFAILRTNFIFWLASVFDMAGSVRGAGHLAVLAFTGFAPARLLEIPAGAQGLAFTPWALLIVALGTVLVIVLGCRQERGMDLDAALASLPAPASAAISFGILLSIGLLGCTAAAKGFIYAQF